MRDQAAHHSRRYANRGNGSDTKALEMLRVDLRSAKPGTELALPVRNPKAANQTLLKVGYALDPKSISRLLELGIRSVWVRYPSLDFLDKYVNSERYDTVDACRIRSVPSPSISPRKTAA